MSFAKILVHSYLRWRSWGRTRFSRNPPPANIPSELRDAFTMGGRIPLLKSYFNDVNRRPLKWTTRSRWWSPDKVANKAQRYYGQTDEYLYRALEKYEIRGKNAVIVGSELPWYECICSCHGARVTTIEYRRIDCQIPGLKVMTPADYARDPKQFDVVLSISSIEHDGLGRYGDPINPRGDIEAMANFKTLLGPGGLLILAVPIGRDALLWNAARIYGKYRFPLLTAGWEILDSYGFWDELFNEKLGRWENQPVFVMRPLGESNRPAECSDAP